MENSSKLSEYKIKINVWNPKEKIIQPFDDWGKNETLKWYKEYNLVKHDRQKNFGLSSLENLLKSIAGLFCIIYSQFSDNAFCSYNPIGIMYSDDGGYSYSEDSLLSIKDSTSWTEEEMYKFDWKELSQKQDRFQQFDFKKI